MSYTIHSYKEIPSRNGVAWSAKMKRDGVLVCHATNGGNGGCDDLDFVSRDERERFTAYADTVSSETFERESDALNKLIIVAQMNRKRTVSFVLRGDDFEGLGQHRSMNSGVTYEQVVAWLRANHPNDEPRIWNKEKGAFVAA